MASLSPNIGKIAGITIQLHWTFLVLLLLAFVLLVAVPDGLFSFLLIILLFVCVLIHELAHSLVSKYNKVEVKKIILLPIGGASIINTDRIKPNVELKIAISGPLTSIGIGIIAGIVLFATSPTGLLQQGILFLFEINILLGVFNILPGFPLDGGRVLRAYLQKKHNFLDSTKIAVKVSKWVVGIFIAGTLVYAAIIPGVSFTYREFVVFWDLIIALFLYDGSNAELQAALIKVHTDRMTAQEMTSKNYILVQYGMATEQLYKSMLEHGTRIALLRKSGKVFGISDKELGKLVSGSKRITQKESRYFSVPVPKIMYSERLSKTLETMRNDEINTVAVFKGRQIIGVIYTPYVDATLQMYLAKHSKSNK